MGVMPLEGTQPSVELKLDEGDILALISDGIYEYTAQNDEQFGEQRVSEVIRDGQALSMAELSQELVGAVRKFGGDAPQADDITIVLVKRLASDEQ